jgi:uncharacterized low-complexity protein
MKTNLKILTGAVLFSAALLVVGTIATNQENLQEQNKTLLASVDVNSNNVIFEGKCGESKPKSKEAKCGEGKCGESKSKSKEAKCGEGKCGESKSKSKEAKCGEGKCGESKSKSKEAKCGEGKCGK